MIFFTYFVDQLDANPTEPIWWLHNHWPENSFEEIQQRAHFQLQDLFVLCSLYLKCLDFLKISTLQNFPWHFGALLYLLAKHRFSAENHNALVLH